jgi:phosphonate transport system permease protein
LKLLLKNSLAWWLLSGLVIILFADLDMSSVDPWGELKLMGEGALSPQWISKTDILHAIFNTIAFAFQGVALGSVVGFILSLYVHRASVRIFCAVIRAVHELFWALIFLQILGLSPLTGVLAIAVPYAGIFAKVYGELMEGRGTRRQRGLEFSGHLSLKIFTQMAPVWPNIKTYTAYRMECALRSSIVLGFIGLPTLGYYLESAFSGGHYGEAAGLLYVLIVLIGTLRWWLKAPFIPLYILLALFYMPPTAVWSSQTLWQFFCSDLMPAPLRTDLLWADWFGPLLGQLKSGIVVTLTLAYLAMLLSGLVALLQFPLISKIFFRSGGRFIGHCLLIFQRSVPELVLAYIFLLLFGPSWLPAILALGIHNGAIVGHLLGRYSSTMVLRSDAVSGIMRYFYEIMPRIRHQFIAFLFYRWEVIQRETVILGLLGVHTLGFYVDSAFEELRFDRAIVLIVVTAALNIALDAFTSRMRRKLDLPTISEQL